MSSHEPLDINSLSVNLRNIDNHGKWIQEYQLKINIKHHRVVVSEFFGVVIENILDKEPIEELLRIQNLNLPIEHNLEFFQDYDEQNNVNEYDLRNCIVHLE